VIAGAFIPRAFAEPKKTHLKNSGKSRQFHLHSDELWAGLLNSGSTRPRFAFTSQWGSTVLHRSVSLFVVLILIAVMDARGSLAQSINVFGDAVPKNPIDQQFPVTIGVKFWSSQPGSIAGIRFYRAVRSSQGYIAKLYSSDGTLLAAVNAQESGPVPGWQEAYFASPIPISANKTYIAAYYCPIGQGAWDIYGLSQGMTNGPITVPASAAVGGNGIYSYGNAFPNGNYEASNFYVDVVFTPAASSPYLVLDFSPPAPSIANNAAPGSTVATIIPSWSDGSPFTGTLSFGSPYSNAQGIFAISGKNLIINPSGPGVSSGGNNTLSITIVATE
jgi:hypothetical protein